MRIAAKLWDCIAGGPETVINAHRLQSGLPLDCFLLFSQKPHVAFHFVGTSPTLRSQHLLLCPTNQLLQFTQELVGHKLENSSHIFLT